MNRIVLLSAAIISVAICACSEKKTNDNNIITTDYEIPTPQEPIAMSPADSQVDVQWIEGRTYHVNISRTPADSLPKVTDNIGQEYIDNKVLITVKRQDGSTFFSQAFVKSTFAEWLDNDYRMNAILNGISFISVNADKLMFTATITPPQAAEDEAIDLMISVDRFGKQTIQQYDDNLRDDLTQEDIASSESAE